ncbi:hypothetical protein J3R82DRAFT_6013 [Butyriboletus roseoflavus]|nr:hypothetical protein J3R82DRAFT_6013 [Butyriboletus roseoflavus]
MFCMQSHHSRRHILRQRSSFLHTRQISSKSVPRPIQQAKWLLPEFALFWSANLRKGGLHSREVSGWRVLEQKRKEAEMGGLECSGGAGGAFKFGEWEGGDVDFVSTCVQVGEAKDELSDDGLNELRDWLSQLPK